MRTIVTGGSASGKSRYAESLVSSLPGIKYYIATMQPQDEECYARIERHRLMREDKGFLTIECYRNLDSLALPERGIILLECLGNLTANEMFSEQAKGKDIYNAIMSGISNLEKQSTQLIVVTNDVFGDGYNYSGDTRRYLETLGALNQTLSNRFERVIEVVCGIPVILKGA